MADYGLGSAEMRFATIIWGNEPIPSGELAKLSEKELGWKKSTSYTVLKRLCGRGLFQNAKGMVTSLVSYEEFQAKQSEKFVEEKFKGSLPSFVAAFCSRKPLSRQDIAQLQEIIDKEGRR